MNANMQTPKLDQHEFEKIVADAAFHNLWTECVGQPGYKKETWLDIQRQLTQAGVICG